jgi:asparagine synthetase A
MNVLGNSLIYLLQQEDLIRVLWKDALQKTKELVYKYPDWDFNQTLVNVFSDKLDAYCTMRAKEIEDKFAKEIVSAVFVEYDWDKLAKEIVIKYNLLKDVQNE